jgi:hypothetical protein
MSDVDNRTRKAYPYHGDQEQLAQRFDTFEFSWSDDSETVIRVRLGILPTITHKNEAKVHI